MIGLIEIGIESLKEVIMALTKKSRTKNIQKQQLIREIRNNLKILNHRGKREVNVSALIESLSNQAISEAYKSGFNFNKLSKGEIPKKIIYNPRCSKYTGWDCKKMIRGIDAKISELKQLPVLYKDFETANINITLRLSNLYHQLTLLAIFIKED